MGVLFSRLVKDHPRGCGEHTATYIDPEHPEGIIPADAGSTFASGGMSTAMTDHPRGCGEHP